MAVSEYKKYFQLTAGLLIIVLLGGVVIVGKISEYATAHSHALRRIRALQAQLESQKMIEHPTSKATHSVPRSECPRAQPTDCLAVSEHSAPCMFCTGDERARSTVNVSALWGHKWTQYVSWQMLRKTRKVVGNVHRLQNFIRKAYRGEATTSLVLGGSNCLEAYTGTRRNFASLIEDWLNQAFPLRDGKKHTVINRGAGGVGACVVSNNLEDYLRSASAPVDLLFLEFAVTDGLELYGGRTGAHQFYMHAPANSPDHDRSRVCFEAIIRTVMAQYPRMALLPIELASVRTMYNGVAAHGDIASFYGVPMLSYRDAVIPNVRSRISPKFQNMKSDRQISLIEQKYGSHRSKNWDGFNESAIWVDTVHVNRWSHRVVREAFVFLIQQELMYAERDYPEKLPEKWSPREGTTFSSPTRYPEANTIAGTLEEVLVQSGSVYRTSATGVECAGAGQNNMDTIDLDHWTFKQLQKEIYQKVMRNKTKEQAKRMCTFTPVHHTSGFKLYEDVPKKRGWISAENSTVPESITFELPLVSTKEVSARFTGYSVWVGYLKSYKGMGKFKVSLSDQTSENPPTIDGLWSRPRSTAEETRVGTCQGSVNVTITTQPTKNGSNKVKILWIRAVGDGRPNP